jgi:hypothetical protein
MVQQRAQVVSDALMVNQLATTSTKHRRAFGLRRCLRFVTTSH